jgi:hypothetical protein
MLEIKRNSSIVPIQTYISWKDQIFPEDGKLICLYHLRDDPEFKAFEKSKLFGNKYFEDFRETSDNKGIYVFNFDSYAKDWDHFINGRYSKLSNNVKKTVREYFKDNHANVVYIESFINPGKYYPIYAELLNVKVDLLKQVGELCEHPDRLKEDLAIEIKDLNLRTINN